MSNNPAVVHYVKILRDAVTNPTKAYFFNSWDCANPKECRQYAISKLKTKFKYSDKAIMKLIDYSCESFDEQGFGKKLTTAHGTWLKSLIYCGFLMLA
jgi:hypothetical protein